MRIVLHQFSMCDLLLQRFYQAINNRRILSIHSERLVSKGAIAEIQYFKINSALSPCANFTTTVGKH